MTGVRGMPSAYRSALTPFADSCRDVGPHTRSQRQEAATSLVSVLPCSDSCRGTRIKSYIRIAAGVSTGRHYRHQELSEGHSSWPAAPLFSAAGGRGLATGNARSATASAAAAAASAAAASAAVTAVQQPQMLTWTILCLAAAAAQYSQDLSSLARRLSAPMVAMALALTLTSIGLLPSSCAVYDFVWTHLMPLSVCLILLETDVSSALLNPGPPITAFAAASISTVVGTVVAFWAVGRMLGAEGWKLASCFCATYIGGSVNYAATAQALGLITSTASATSSSSSSLFTSAMAVDNLLTAVFFAVLAALPDAWPTNSNNTNNPDASPVIKATAGRVAGSLSPPPLPPSLVNVSRGNEGESSEKGPSDDDKGSVLPLAPSPPSSASIGRQRRSVISAKENAAFPPSPPSPPPQLSVQSLLTSLAAASACIALSASITNHMLPPGMRGSQLAVAALLASLMSAVGSRLPEMATVGDRASDGRKSTAEIDARDDDTYDGSGRDRAPGGENGSEGGGGALRGELMRVEEVKARQQTMSKQEDNSSGRCDATTSSIFHGASLLGGTGMMLFFCAIGASASITEAAACGPFLFLFISLLLAVHLTLVLAMGWLLGLPLDLVLLASNAAVGGPATSAGMASSRGWSPDLVRLGVILGTVGYTIGSAVAFLLGTQLLRRMVLL